MALNKKGILELAADLVAHKKRYDQGTFGMFRSSESHDRELCGTFCCLAGFCYSAEIGAKKFNALVKADVDVERQSLRAGKKQLGLHKKFPVIFKGIDDYWPADLYEEYFENGAKGRVIVALKALQRLLPDGTIDQNPKAVHTRIPQLKELLASTKRTKRLG